MKSGRVYNSFQFNIKSKFQSKILLYDLRFLYVIHDVKKKNSKYAEFPLQLKPTAGPSIEPWRAPLVTDFYLDPVGIKPSGISHSASPQFQFSSKVIKNS